MTISNLALHALNPATKKANLLSHAFECATQKALNVGDGVKAQLVNIDPQHAMYFFRFYACNLVDVFNNECVRALEKAFTEGVLKAFSSLDARGFRTAYTTRAKEKIAEDAVSLENVVLVFFVKINKVTLEVERGILPLVKYADKEKYSVLFFNASFKEIDFEEERFKDVLLADVYYSYLPFPSFFLDKVTGDLRNMFVVPRWRKAFVNYFTKQCQSQNLLRCFNYTKERFNNAFSFLIES